MNCPQCSQAMQTINYEGVTVESCNGCGGEFLGPGEMAHIVQTREMKFGSEIRTTLAGHEPIFGVPAVETQRTLECPQCAQSMAVMNYPADTGVCVDRCSACGGLWLDHEELEKVQALQERWCDEASEKLQSIAGDLEKARQDAAASTNKSFAGSRFAFVNALINRVLDAA